MAGEYTAGAYAKVTPIKEDFGDIALKGAESLWKQNAAMIAARKQRLEEAKLAQKRVEDNFKEFDELAAKALNIHAKNFDKEMVDIMIASSKSKIGDYARELNDPNTSSARAIQIRTEMRVLANSNLDFVAGQKKFAEFVNELNNIDKENGYDSILSGTSLLNVGRAIISAGEKGVSDADDGTYDVGDYLKFKLDEKGAPVIMMKNDNGDWVTGTIDETIVRCKAQMVPYVDLQKNLWDYAGKGVQPRINEKVLDNSGEYISIVTETDWKKTKDAIGADFDSRFPDAQSLDKLPKEIRKAIASGKEAGWNSREDIRDEYIRRGMSQIVDKYKIRIRNKPRDSKGAGSQEAMDTISNEFLAQAQSTASGDRTAVNYFVGRRSALNVPGVKAGDAKIESIDIKDGKVRMVVGGDYEKGYPKDYTKEYLFDVSNPEDQGVYLNALAFAFNDGKPTKQQVDVSALRNYYDSSVPITNIRDKILPPDIETNLSSIEEKLKGTGQLTTDEIYDIVKDLKNKMSKIGYNMDISGKWWIGNNMEISITDDNGKQLKKIKTKDKETLAKALRNFVSDVLGRNEVSKNDSWLLSNRKPGVQSTGSVPKETQAYENKQAVQKENVAEQRKESETQEPQGQETKIKLSSEILDGMKKIDNGEGDDQSKFESIKKYLRGKGFDDEKINDILKKLKK